MSSALSSAKNRRTNGQSFNPTIPPPVLPNTSPFNQNPPLPSNAINQPNIQENMNNKLTLPQVITLVDARLTKLETHIKQQQQNKQNSNDNNINSNLLNDLNTKYDILAVEMNELKDVILQLQKYTMNVNDMLLHNSKFSSILENDDNNNNQDNNNEI